MKKEKIIQGTRRFLSFLLWMLLFGMAVRLFEAALLGYYQEEFWKQLFLCGYGCCIDLLVFSRWSLLIYPLFLLIHHFSAKAARWTLRILGTILLLTSNAMIMYYVTANIPLDKVFFSYSVEQLMYIAQSTGSFVWWGYVCLLLIPVFFLVVSRKEIIMKTLWLLLWLGLAMVGLWVNKVPVWMFGNREEMNTVSNKQEVFWKSVLWTKDQFERLDPNRLDLGRIGRFQAMFPENEFVDPRYPLAHNDLSLDVLSGYFDLDSVQKPDFVFIIVEGLGREFSGYNSRFPSATPFLDSLAETGLSWVNCMSSSQRTFAVLPTLFGSLPFGKNGFMQSPMIPRFHSLVEILKDNQYEASFFYGGWLCFDDMCYFTRNLGIDHYLPDYSTYPAEMQNTWGLYDHELFAEGLKRVAEQDSLPRLDIYLTLSTHDPFVYPDKEQYTEFYTNALIEHHQQHNIQQFQYEQYASYLYFDDCLRNFIADYQLLPNYKNTIFVITGDHDFNNLTIDLERYHVPLVIWSPMLKEAHCFPAMVTHRDITPSIVALMRQVYAIRAPQVVGWLNTGLDTVSYFRTKSFSPAMKVSRDKDMIINEFFIENGMVCMFEYNDDKLTVKPVNGEEILLFAEEYWAMDDYVMNHDALLPTEENQQKVLWEFDRNDERLDFNQVYPYTFLDVTMADSLEAVRVTFDFDILIPKQEEQKAITVSLAVTHHDKQKEMLSNLVINGATYEYDDCWQHFSMQQILKKGLHYQSEERVYGYFYNPGEHPFAIKNVKLRLTAL